MNAPKVFDFDAVSRWVESRSAAQRGPNDAGWQSGLAVRLCADEPGLTYQNARQRLLRRRGRMIDAYEADRYAITLGVHPCEIWPNWFDLAGVEIIRELQSRAS